MVSEKIMYYYIHGYLSSTEGDKATLLRERLQATAISYRDGPPEKLNIADAIVRIMEAIGVDSQAMLIGSSLGGLLAAKTAKQITVNHLILINPAIIPPFVDLSTIDDMPDHILKEMRDEQLFLSKIQTKIDILVGTNDETVPNEWSIEFAKAQQASIHFFKDDHRFSNHLNDLPKIIKDLC